MTTYVSSFIPGMGEVVAEALRHALEDLEIDLLLDGLVVYRSSSSVANVQALRFCNNSFVCLMSFDGLGRDPIAEMVQTVQADGQLLRRLTPFLPGKVKTYRFVASYGNQFVSIPQRSRTGLERLLSGNTRLKPDHSNPDVEFWLLARREGFGFVGMRITRHTAYEKTLERGELRPELCHLLCLISDPSEADVVLDPFCGSGAIPLARANAFPYQTVLTGDIDAKLIKSLRMKLRRQRQKVVIGRWDALNLRTFASDSVGKIITDPPWGFYRMQNADPRQFHQAMLKEFHRVLRLNGLLVLIVGTPDIFEDCMRDFAGKFTVLKRYDVLVSGKKASVYKIEKAA